jgi:hypothetical protein
VRDSKGRDGFDKFKIWTAELHGVSDDEFGLVLLLHLLRGIFLGRCLQHAATRRDSCYNSGEIKSYEVCALLVCDHDHLRERLASPYDERHKSSHFSLEACTS